MRHQDSSAQGRRREPAGALSRATSIAITTAAGLLATVLPATITAAPVPPGIADPDVATRDPVFSDPVLWWRLSSMPKNPFEPEPYFYWPDATIHGAPGAPLPNAAPGRTTLDARALADVAAWAESHDSTALIVIHRGVVQLERYWKGQQPDQLANGRAITRSVAPMVLGFAVAEGKLSLEDPIGRFITEWRDDPRGKITVRQLAQNVSGLEVAPEMPLTVVHGHKDLCLAYCGDVVRAALAYDAARPPGTSFEVASENSQLLGLVIERAMGAPIQTLVSERIWKPIGAGDATYQFDRPGGTARIMCCMRATPRDWARLGLLVAQDGKWNGKPVLAPGWVKTMATPSARNPNFGLGLWLGSPFNSHRGYFENSRGEAIRQTEPFLADDVRFMEGGGNRVVMVVPSKQLVVFRHGKSSPDWDQAYLVNRLLRK